MTVTGHLQITKKATWAAIATHYEELEDRPLAPQNLRGWLADFSALDEAVDEAYVLAMIDYTADTGNAEAEATYRQWGAEILPPLHEIRVHLGRRLLQFEEHLPDLATFLRELKTDVEIFRSENLPRMSALEEMEATYDK